MCSLCSRKIRFSDAGDGGLPAWDDPFADTPDATKEIFFDDGDGVFPLAADTVGGGEITLNAPTTVATTAQLADYLVNGFWAYNNALPHHWASNTITYNISGLNADEQFLALSAMAAWHDVANINFVQTSGTANITFTHTGSMQAVTYASWYGSGAMASATVNISTNWVTTDGGANDGKTGIDSYAYQTYVHEVGHALGLGHQGPYNGSANYSTNAIFANDTWQYSIMSYFSQPNYSGSSYRYVVTPQMADIYAVGTMYGAATTTRIGDTVYGFNSNAGAVFNFGAYTSAPALTIYDSGGSDTLDCSLYSSAQRIDLRAGNFSSVGGLTNNIGIALNSVIERAIGGSGNDTLIANNLGCILAGGTGADTLIGGAGSDTASYSFATAGLVARLDVPGRNTGEAAGDSYSGIENLYGSQFADTLCGNGGANILTGWAGNDSLWGYGGGDTLNGGDGNDYLVGAAGADTFIGGNGNDTVSYYFATAGLMARLDRPTLNTGEAAGDSYSGIENLYGSQFADTLCGTTGANILTGWAGNDSLWGYGGGDTLNGGDGNDYLVGAAGADTFIGGNGSDTVSYYFATSGVTASLAAPANNTGEAAGDTYSGVENILGSAYNDDLLGNSSANLLQGGNGNDTLTGGIGSDILSGGAGNDTFVFRPGDAPGDTITDFVGNGVGLGDQLVFAGFGAGATFTMIDATHWQVNYDGDTIHEIITFSNAVSLHSSDILFV
jgi:Ca2+-binding RTX toxin-like protein